VRLNIFPDGGVARLRVYGDCVPDWDRLRRRGEIDLAAAEHGGFVVACSDMFFGSRHNLIMPGDAHNMGDGWETKRRRGPGHDWTIVRLGAPGTIGRVEVDTRHFKGNAPGACSLEASLIEGAPTDLVTGPGIEWRELMPRRALSRTSVTRSTTLRRSPRSPTYGSIFFRTAALDGCGCSESPDDDFAAERAGIAEPHRGRPCELSVICS
jgi:allantoicase